MKTQNKISCSSKGFTLMELLIAMGIFAIVAAVVYGAYKSTFYTIENAEYQIDVSGRVQTFFDRITEDIELIYQGENSYFEGTQETIDAQRADRLIMVSAADLRLSREQTGGNLVQLAYFAKRNEESGLLDIYRSETAFEPDEEVDYESKGLLICKEVKEFKLVYIGDDQNEADEWNVNTGENDTGIGNEIDIIYPALVRIVLTFGTSDNVEENTTYQTTVFLKWKVEK